ncbi:hypothetical protein BJ508DRAFT_301037 [Ascobolus immersus RN42]|uniref:Uncharacterized protein n=1 Tax=Ascobolus immersus RN42 TaxID=1160509 RepID=A0A3N4ISV1_ASCIM|nr:hypothetical protein BJ508DRAFT_301037 [Ascobolus immersus RN42]
MYRGGVEERRTSQVQAQLPKSTASASPKTSSGSPQEQVHDAPSSRDANMLSPGGSPEIRNFEHWHSPPGPGTSTLPPHSLVKFLLISKFEKPHAESTSLSRDYDILFRRASGLTGKGMKVGRSACCWLRLLASAIQSGGCQGVRGVAWAGGTGDRGVGMDCVGRSVVKSRDLWIELEGH